MKEGLLVEVRLARNHSCWRLCCFQASTFCCYSGSSFTIYRYAQGRNTMEKPWQVRGMASKTTQVNLWWLATPKIDGSWYRLSWAWFVGHRTICWWRVSPGGTNTTTVGKRDAKRVTRKQIRRLRTNCPEFSLTIQCVPSMYNEPGIYRRRFTFRSP